jgi:tRNA-binding EMAP/Myf-like protein
MRVSLDWLKDWVEIAGEPRELADRLTMAGLEVEAIEAAAPPLAGIVVGEVVSCARHPNADTLSVCQVSTGGSPMQIVCGAPNVRAGMKVAVATIGSRLPGGVEIRAASLRGVDSNGMLCSGRELGLGDESDGILDLPSDLEIGAPLTQALRLDDTILTVNVTPNRGDCMSVLGIAREVAATSHQSLRKVSTPAASVRADASVPVELTAGAGCERFVSRVIRDVRADAASPAWLQERLRRAGIATDQCHRRCHELRDARCRPADARLRPRRDRSRHRRAPRADRRVARAAGRTQRRHGRGRARDRGPQQGAGSRRRDGWEPLGNRPDDERRCCSRSRGSIRPWSPVVVAATVS